MTRLPVVPEKYDFKRTNGEYTYTVILGGWFKKKVKIFTISPGILKVYLRFIDEEVFFIDILERKGNKWTFGKYPITDEQQEEITRHFLQVFPELKEQL